MTNIQQKNEIIYLYQKEYLSLNQIAKKCNITSWIVREVLKNNNIKTRSSSEGMRIRLNTNNISDMHIIDLYNHGWSCKEISKHFHKCDGFAYSRLKKQNVKFRKQSGRPGKLNLQQEKLLYQDYQNGMHIDVIANKYGFKSSSPVYNILMKFKINNRNNRISNHEEIILLYNSGLSGVQISNLFHISTSSVYRVLEKYNQIIRDRKGSNNRGWKGGVSWPA